MELTISGKDKKLLKQVEDLAKRLGLRIQKEEEKKTISDEQRSEELYRLMTKMAESGGIQSIKDPIAWQREIRKDKKLFGRE